MTETGAINAIKAQILDVDGVTAINSFNWNFDRKNRRLTVEFEAQTDYGIVQYP